MPLLELSFIFIPVNANPIPLDHVLRLYLACISGLLLAKAAGSDFPLAGKRCKFYATFFDHWPTLRCLVLVTNEQQDNQLWSLNNYASHVLSNGRKNRRIHISYRRTLNIYFYEFHFFTSNQGSIKNLKICRVTYLGVYRMFKFLSNVLKSISGPTVPLSTLSCFRF